MKLEYSVALEDVIAFNNHHMEATPSIRRKLSVMRFVWSFAPLLAIYLITSFEGMEPGKAMWIIGAVAVGISAPIFLFQPFYLRWCNNRQVRKVYSNEKNQAMLGVREIKVASNCLIETTPAGENQSEYALINRVDADENYTFIYAANSKVHIIPSASVTSGDYAEFVSELKKKVGTD
jgi:hypothetical protein